MKEPSIYSEAFYKCPKCKDKLRVDPYGNVVCQCTTDITKRCPKCGSRIGDQYKRCYLCGAICQ